MQYAYISAGCMHADWIVRESLDRGGVLVFFLPHFHTWQWVENSNLDGHLWNITPLRSAPMASDHAFAIANQFCYWTFSSIALLWWLGNKRLEAQYAIIKREREAQRKLCSCASLFVCFFYVLVGYWWSRSAIMTTKQLTRIVWLSSSARALGNTCEMFQRFSSSWHRYYIFYSYMYYI